MLVRRTAFVALLLSLAGCVATRPPVTTRSLLREMTDLDGLTKYPDPPFKTAQSSSYDRRSTSPTQPEPPEQGWFANNDFNHFVRTETRAGRTEYVLLDVAGPGAIVRIWSANPKGALRIYLDGAEQPTLEAPMVELLSGRTPGVPDPIGYVRSRGGNCYLPIPYARHCRITSDRDQFYYHVNYRTYPAGTPVETFQAEQLAALAPELGQTAGRLAAPAQGGTWPSRNIAPVASGGERSGADNQPEALACRLSPGETAGPARLTGPAAVRRLAARVTAADMDLALRQTVLMMTCDGQRTVECPLGDFFGGGPGLNAYESLPLGVDADGRLWSHWVMPFEKTAEFVVRNLGGQDVQVTLEWIVTPYRWTDRAMHFHAGWRAEFDVPTRPMRDLRVLEARARGVFVGAAFAISNPVRHWWGEGDEKIWVDGESFPSFFGTGTEDYFGYAWASNVPFRHAYHNQPRSDGPGNYGWTANNRWHILDRIPFERDFRFDLELWHWHPQTRISYAVTAYWYARPGAADDFAPLTAADLQLRPLPKYVVFTVPGAIEGEKLRVLGKRDAARVDPHLQEGASGDETLLYHYDTKLGDRLELGFEVPRAGRYRVLARFLKSRDFGIVQWSVNGTPAGPPVDLYAPEAALTEEIPLGTFDLPAGENRLGAELVGTNEQSIYQRYMLGLDYIRLEPATP